MCFGVTAKSNRTPLASGNGDGGALWLRSLTTRSLTMCSCEMFLRLEMNEKVAFIFLFSVFGRCLNFGILRRSIGAQCHF